MEAVGQLTGGIAHDFNNLLTVILGNAEVLAEGLAEGAFRGMAQVVLEAAEKGAGLTQQLLAFGRRQTLRSEPLRPAEVVEGMMPLLRRTLGEHIVLRTAFTEGQAPAMADRTLLESAILNLAINARDAMPHGGVLEIATDDVMIDAADRSGGARPGRYAALIVSDTGSGMAPDVLERAFEPFFTTKEVGRGSGLGLSMVYGFAQQSGGHVSIQSQPGRGASVTVLLPLAERHETLSPPPPVAASATPHVRTRILVVEDETDVRRFVTSLLLVLGHEVVEAGTGQSGLKVLRSDPAIDLLFTDVVLPGGMSGVELARQARQIRPDLKVLLTSGYPDGALQERGGAISPPRFCRSPTAGANSPKRSADRSTRSVSRRPVRAPWRKARSISHRPVRAPTREGPPPSAAPPLPVPGEEQARAEHVPWGPVRTGHVPTGEQDPGSEDDGGRGSQARRPAVSRRSRAGRTGARGRGPARVGRCRGLPRQRRRKPGSQRL
jgi:CheY-like chemotaxis protein